MKRKKIVGENIFTIRKHGVDLPNWMWNLCQEGRIRNCLSSKTQYIIHALREQAKRDGFWGYYSELIQNNKVP